MTFIQAIRRRVGLHNVQTGRKTRLGTPDISWVKHCASSKAKLKTGDGEDENH